ncbi:MAG: galactokinase [Bryobacteraceae bacterium]
MANGLIVTRTPLRISFAGGGTDLAAFYREHSGAVVSTTIDKYVYVTLKRHDSLFGAPIRLNYSETEQVETVAEIRNDIARACFEFLGIGAPIYMSTVADLPAASGLGSSSAFCVGLLHALHLWRGEHPSAGQLAEEAAHIEIEVLGRPIGKQDHYAAAYGGFNYFKFLPSGGVAVEQQRFESDGLERLFGSLMLFWTGLTRDAGRVLVEQQRNTPARIVELTELRDQAGRMQAMLGNGFHAGDLGRYLDGGWQLKRNLAAAISNPRIDGWYRRAMEAGADGGKLCGAGGGGFLLFAVRPEARVRVREALGDLREIPVKYEPRGSRLLMPHAE